MTEVVAEKIELLGGRERKEETPSTDWAPAPGDKIVGADTDEAGINDDYGLPF